jgi:uncharacterized protein
MQDISAILDNHVLLVAVIACLIAQVLKLVFEFARHGKVNFRTIVETGVEQSMGWESSEFAIALIFAIIVMYDATGVRQAAGKQARILNQIVDELFRGDTEFAEERLKELLGHTPVQVIVGCLLGITISWLAGPA